MTASESTAMLLCQMHPEELHMQPLPCGYTTGGKAASACRVAAQGGDDDMLGTTLSTVPLAVLKRIRWLGWKDAKRIGSKNDNHHSRTHLRLSLTICCIGCKKFLVEQEAFSHVDEPINASLGFHIQHRQN